MTSRAIPARAGHLLVLLGGTLAVCTPVQAMDCSQIQAAGERYACYAEQKYGGTVHFEESVQAPLLSDFDSAGDPVLADGERRYHVYEPEGFEPGRPLVIVLHGGTLRHHNILNVGDGPPDWEDSTTPSEWLAIAEDEDLLVVAPNGTRPIDESECGDASEIPGGEGFCGEQATTVDKQHWNDCRDNAGVSTVHSDDVAFISELIDEVAADFAIDTNRVYVTGASNGGMMAYRIGRELPDKVAAVASSIANNPLTLTGNDECVIPVEPMPVMIMNGTLDVVIPYLGGGLTGLVKSAPATRTDWRNWNNAPLFATNTVHYPNESQSDGSTVTCKLYDPGNAGAPVNFCRVDGGGHSEPSLAHPVPEEYENIGLQNRDIETAHEFWEFLEPHTVLGQ